MQSKGDSIDRPYRFVLYIDSAKPKSLCAIDRLRELCRNHLNSSYTLGIVDLKDNPELIEERKIIAAPTLDIITPESKKHRFIGDLSQSEEFIIAIGMLQKAIEMSKQATCMRENIKSLR
jgi:circadian clock protein KaiB